MGAFVAPAIQGLGPGTDWVLFLESWASLMISNVLVQIFITVANYINKRVAVIIIIIFALPGFPLLFQGSQVNADSLGGKFSLLLFKLPLDLSLPPLELSFLNLLLGQGITGTGLGVGIVSRPPRTLLCLI